MSRNPFAAAALIGLALSAAGPLPERDVMGRPLPPHRQGKRYRPRDADIADVTAAEAKRIRRRARNAQYAAPSDKPSPATPEQP